MKSEESTVEITGLPEVDEVNGKEEAKIAPAPPLKKKKMKKAAKKTGGAKPKKAAKAPKAAPKSKKSAATAGGAGGKRGPKGNKNPVRAATDGGKFGARILAKRKKLGLTQKQLATKAGVSQGCVCNVEKGTCDASEKLQTKLKKVVGL